MRTARLAGCCLPSVQPCDCTRTAHPDIQHTIDGDGDVVLSDGCLMADGDRQLLEAVHIRDAVDLGPAQTQGSHTVMFCRPHRCFPRADRWVWWRDASKEPPSLILSTPMPLSCPMHMQDWVCGFCTATCTGCTPTTGIRKCRPASRIRLNFPNLHSNNHVCHVSYHGVMKGWLLYWIASASAMPAAAGNAVLQLLGCLESCAHHTEPNTLQTAMPRCMQM